MSLEKQIPLTKISTIETKGLKILWATPFLLEKTGLKEDTVVYFPNSKYATRGIVFCNLNEIDNLDNVNKALLLNSQGDGVTFYVVKLRLSQ
jgi:hypothetical protein